jgi:hypothetical protein
LTIRIAATAEIIVPAPAAETGLLEPLAPLAHAASVE